MFKALGDPVRAAIVEHLGRAGEATVSDLAGRFPISIQAVSKHLQVLAEAGVISQRRHGRQRPVRLRRGHLSAAQRWLGTRLDELEARYARLDQLLTTLHEEPGATP